MRSKYVRVNVIVRLLAVAVIVLPMILLVSSPSVAQTSFYLRTPDLVCYGNADEEDFDCGAGQGFVLPHGSENAWWEGTARSTYEPNYLRAVLFVADILSGTNTLGLHNCEAGFNTCPAEMTFDFHWWTSAGGDYQDNAYCVEYVDSSGACASAVVDSYFSGLGWSVYNTVQLSGSGDENIWYRYGVTWRFGWDGGLDDASVTNIRYVFEGLEPTPTPTPLNTATPMATSTQMCYTPTAPPAATAVPSTTPFSLTPTPPMTITPAATQEPFFGPIFFHMDTGLGWSPGDLPPVQPPIAQSISHTMWLGNVLGPETYHVGEGVPRADLGVGLIGDSMMFLSVHSQPNVDQHIYDALTYHYPGPGDGFPSPILIRGYARFSEPLTEGQQVYLRAAYLDEDYNETGAYWVGEDGHDWAVDSGWNFFSLGLMTPANHRVTAVAIWWLKVGDELPGHGVMLDEIELSAGDPARNSGVPICQGTGGSGSTPPQTKLCVIKLNTLDVFDDCTPPSNVLDLIGWLSYWWCRLWRYFSFLNENRQQVIDIQVRQNTNEPIGTISELQDTFGAIGETIASVGDVYAGSNYRSFDFASLLDWSALDQPISLNPAPNDNTYLATCPAIIANVSQTTQRTACFVADILKRKFPQLALLQWFFDISAVMAFLFFLQRSFMAKPG